MTEPATHNSLYAKARSVAWSVLRYWRRGMLITLLGPAIAIATIIVILLLPMPQLRELVREIWPKAPTSGHIYVGTPKVYTRERLVNDRFRQQAWLDSQLLRTDRLIECDAFASIEGRIARRETQRTRLTANLDVKGQDGDAKTADGDVSTAKQVAKSDGSTLAPEPVDVFRDALAYRDEIRAELMRTQLDDSHDIEGNTLYRLDFDVTIAPGDNTRASAEITVEVEEDRKEDLKHYSLLYADWHKHLQTTIDSGIQALTEVVLSPSGELEGPEQMGLPEFLEQASCEAFKAIMHSVGWGKSAINCDAVDSARMEYTSAYTQARSEEVDRASVSELLAALKTQQRQDLPEPLRKIQDAQTNARDSLSPAEQEALSYAKQKCSGAKGEEFYEEKPANGSTTLHRGHAASAIAGC